MEWIRQYPVTRTFETILNVQRKLHPLFRAALAAIILAVLYWGVIASDRFVSEAHVIVDRTDSGGSQGKDIASILTGGGDSSHDLLLLRDHLLSVDMLQKLDAKLDLRSHYSDIHRDPISRMWLKNAPLESFQHHILSRISIARDLTDGVMVIRTQAYSAEMAHAITVFLVEEGENFMNEMAHTLASEQVAFLEKQVAQLGDRVMKTRNALVSYQNAKGLISPQSTAESLVVIVSRLEGQISDLKARRQAMLGYLSANAPDVSQLTLQINALEKQLREERARMASNNGVSLNRTVEEYQRLQMEADFAKDLYHTALLSLEKGRVESTRMLRKVSILQKPSHPEYPLEPRRAYNIIVFSISALVLAGIALMLTAIIRDHKD